MFSHIYIEKSAFASDVAKKALNKYTEAKVILIDHYKDVFNRNNQSFQAQKKSQALIIANRQDSPIYKGSPLCQSFGNINFYYTSNILNCPFDCEYCYLQGMYQSGNIVIFSDLEYVFEEVGKVIDKPSYFCISYDTDLLAFENTFGFVEKWIDFVKLNENLKIEVRTKCGNFNFNSSACENVIFAWSLSPENIISRFEHKTGTLKGRINSIKKALKIGFPVRICFDPILYFKDFEKEYKKLINYVFSEINSEEILDVSAGVFRISSQYMKVMRKQCKNPIVFYPFVCENGSYHYGNEKNKYMNDYVKEQLLNYITEDKIFIWKG